MEPLPEDIEQGVRQFASERQMGHDEAVLKLIEAGLRAIGPKRETAATPEGSVRIPGLPDGPMSDEDAAMMDEIVSEAMEARRKRWERYLSV